MDTDNRIARIEHDLMARYYADGAATTWQRAFVRIAELEQEVEQLTRQRDAALAACRAVATDEAEDPCYYDHHGYCQAHGLQPKGECYMELARAAIKLMEEPSS